MELLQYRAGTKALEILRTRGLSPNELQALLLPAIGPKWLVLAGFDRALLQEGWFDALPGRLLLFGASVGAWRALALAARDPQRAHSALLDAYCEQRFSEDDSPSAISDAYQRLLRQVFSDDDLANAAHHPKLDLAIATARARGPLALNGHFAQAAALGSAALLNSFSPRAQRLFYQRVVFMTGPDGQSPYPMLRAAGGIRTRLTTRNMREVALASGTVPLYMKLVRDIPDAPSGAYLDGGFSDYHLNRTADAGAGLSILFLHQSRIIPSWLDKFVPWRHAGPEVLSRLLLVHPSDDFVRSLPGSAIPTRDDFKRFVREPEARIARWRAVAAQSGELATSFLRDVTSGAIAARARAL